ncbi:SH3 domain-binding glutamic acid-rich-like protein 2 isoform X1 [Mauremys reevesii]|uniref:SH3 domain-binding glutamic acid-rich-like protein 2 isoform X1 n=1 Tax=Mauremys reevesii TaxID=260615 RepID=UPI00193F4553|nr:SH3 domain-binding glutamic acid-rich-like protein 2 isoform X1 [Mauremys reevesii]
MVIRVFIASSSGSVAGTVTNKINSTDHYKLLEAFKKKIHRPTSGQRHICKRDCGLCSQLKICVFSSFGLLLCTVCVQIKKRQQDVVRFLEANRIDFEEVDITMSEEKRQWMYKNIPEERQPAQGNPLPPQIFNDDQYCGDYDCFFEAKESNTVFSFLGLKPSLASKESEP